MNFGSNSHRFGLPNARSGAITASEGQTPQHIALARNAARPSPSPAIWRAVKRLATAIATEE